MAKVLIIEDEVGIRANLAIMLRMEGHETLEAANGREGLTLAQSAAPDLILCDVLMPEVDGFGVLAGLRDDPRTATIPFVFVSASADVSDLERGLASGAAAYLTKPFNLKELLATVASVLPPN